VQLRELVVAPLSGFRRGTGLPCRELGLAGAQLDAPELARDGLRQGGELDAADPLVWR